jgi:hypothetical protein
VISARSAHLAAVAAIAVVVVGAAHASDVTVRRSFVRSDVAFNGWWKVKSARSPDANATAADAEAAKVTIARTELAVDAATTASARLGRALALQAFAKLIAGCRAWAAFESDQVSDPDLQEPQTLDDAQRASDAFTAARPLLAAAARALHVKITLYRFAQLR